VSFQLINRGSGTVEGFGAATVVVGYEVDGLSSTRIFAGARGTGDDVVNTVTHTSTISGKLNLAGSDEG
jgi:hypothetical protein